MLRSDTREIGGKTYQIHELSAKPGREMMIKLFKLAGPSIAAALRSLEGGLKLSELPSVGIADAITELCQRVSVEDFEHICNVFMSSTEVLNQETGGFVKLPAFNAFSGDYGSLFKLLSFHIEFNYSSFLEGLGLTKLRS